MYRHTLALGHAAMSQERAVATALLLAGLKKGWLKKFGAHGSPQQYKLETARGVLLSALVLQMLSGHSRMHRRPYQDYMSWGAHSHAPFWATVQARPCTSHCASITAGGDYRPRVILLRGAVAPTCTVL